MKVTLYLEYENEDLSFDIDNNFYNEENYVKKLEDSYNQTKDVIFDNMSNGVIQKTTLFSQFNINNNRNSNDKALYSACSAILYDENLNEETYNNLVNYSINNDSFINIINLDFDTSEEEFESEFKMWYTVHTKINSIQQNDEWKFKNEPTKDIKIKMHTNDNNECYALLKNCKLIDYIDNKGYIILIEKISFI